MPHADPGARRTHTPICSPQRASLRTAALAAFAGLLLAQMPTLSLAQSVSFVPATNVTVGNQPAGLAVGDFNRDGHADLAVGNELDDDISILFGNGTGAFPTRTDFPLPLGDARCVGVGDLDRDGDQIAWNKTPAACERDLNSSS